MVSTYLQAEEAGVHSIDHFALAVPDIEAAKHFLDAFGLEARREQEGLAIHALDQHCWGRIFLGPRKALTYLLFNCYESDLRRLAEQVAAADGREKSSPLGWDFTFQTVPAISWRSCTRRMVATTICWPLPAAADEAGIIPLGM